MKSLRTQIADISSENVGALLSFAIGGEDGALVDSCMDLFSDMSPEDNRQLMADLNRKINHESSGPLSIQRIAKINHAENSSDKTFLQVLTSDSSTSDELDMVAKYGNILMQPMLPPGTRRTGCALYTSAKMSLATHFNRKLSDTIRQAAKVVSESLD